MNRVHYAQGRLQFTADVLQNEIYNPFPRFLEPDKWKGYEDARSEWEQEQMKYDEMAGRLGV